MREPDSESFRNVSYSSSRRSEARVALVVGKVVVVVEIEDAQRSGVR